jgi:hypothetical protein
MTASWFLVALRHDRAVVRGSLAFVVLLAWSYLLLGAGVVDLSFQTPGSEHPDQLMEALELFGKNVLPHIRDI